MLKSHAYQNYKDIKTHPYLQQRFLRVFEKDRKLYFLFAFVYIVRIIYLQSICRTCTAQENLENVFFFSVVVWFDPKANLGPCQTCVMEFILRKQLKASDCFCTEVSS